MTIVKQMDIRDNIKKYFDMAHDGEPIIVPRKNNKNVVIISEGDYREFEKYKRNAEYVAMLKKSMEQAREGGFVETTIEQLESFE